MVASQQYDAETIAILRRALDDVFTDPRFLNRRSTSALQIAEHLLAQAEDEAISLITIGVDFGITQVVDGNWGVHAVIKKDIFAGGET